MIRVVFVFFSVLLLVGCFLGCAKMVWIVWWIQLFEFCSKKHHWKSLETPDLCLERQVFFLIQMGIGKCIRSSEGTTNGQLLGNHHGGNLLAHS